MDIDDYDYKTDIFNDDEEEEELKFSDTESDDDEIFSDEYADDQDDGIVVDVSESISLSGSIISHTPIVINEIADHSITTNGNSTAAAGERPSSVVAVNS